MGWYTSTALSIALASLALVLVDIVWWFKFRIERRGHPLPPGPIPVPFIGSVLSINARLPWLSFTKWRAKYGDIIYIRALDTDIIVLNSTSVATELLEKRSWMYSDRPSIVTAAPYGHDCNFAILPYGEHWRLCRRIFHETYHANAALTFRPTQLRRARELIRNMIDDPNEYPSHFQTFSAAVSMSAVYDYEPIPRNDPMVSVAHNYLHAALPGMGPGRIFLLKVFPFLLHIPGWLPGSWISRETINARAWKSKLVETPYKHVQKRMESQEHVNAAMVPEHITRLDRFSGPYRSEYETALKHVAVSAVLGSAETATSALMTFTLAMVENPHVWKRAQLEIDAVVGTGRLPNFDDRPCLPYVDAIVRETLRWRPVTPLIAPHAVTYSDIYQGYYIPKGATIIVNAWAISRDAARYPDAETFLPERFLNAEGRLTDDDPSEFAFGFWRRKCPGRHAADASLWSAMATMLATLNFNLAKDAEGNDVMFEATFTNGATDHPYAFPCRLTPRTHINKEHGMIGLGGYSMPSRDVDLVKWFHQSVTVQ